MDIIDIILGRATTSQSKMTSYANTAATAAASAAAAAETLENASETLTAINNAVNNMSSTINTEIDKLLITLNQVNGTEVVNNLLVKYPDNTEKTVNSIIKLYKTTGNNEDGGMTQKAITTALAALESRIGSGGGSGTGGSTNLGYENTGKVVVVGPNGNIIASGNLGEAEILEALLGSENYTLTGCTGLSIDYENKTYTRTQEAKNISSGNAFNKYAMFGGRMRCVVNDAGQIVSFYGDNDYDESAGQVMVYQPKFYYKRIIGKTSDTLAGTAIREEQLILSPAKISGFKLHPLFIDKFGNELPYVLLSAYEGSVYSTGSAQLLTNDESTVNFNTDKLSSKPNVKPVSGINKELTIDNLEKLGANRGTGWSITNLQYESAEQMLMMVEYGNLNLQSAFEAGLSLLPNNTNYNCASITGSTASLGNASGAAASTTQTINGVSTSYDVAGKRAISYRGVENPWGNIWRMVGDARIIGNGQQFGGIVKVAKYTNGNFTNYEGIGFSLPNTYGWIYAFGYNSDYDWAYIPVECNNSANSAVPVGDNLWTYSNLNNTNMLCCGGLWYFDDSNGPFYYAGDKSTTVHQRGYSGRLMFTPSYNTNITNTNYNNWLTHWEATL